MSTWGMLISWRAFWSMLQVVPLPQPSTSPTFSHGVQFRFCGRRLQLAQSPHERQGAWSPLGRPLPEWIGMRRVRAFQRLVNKADAKSDVWSYFSQATVVRRPVLVANTEPAARVTLNRAAKNELHRPPSVHRWLKRPKVQVMETIESLWSGKLVSLRHPIFLAGKGYV